MGDELLGGASGDAAVTDLPGIGRQQQLLLRDVPDAAATGQALHDLVVLPAVGDVEIDGYTYELNEWVLDGYKLQPMFETKVYLFATIPDSLLENFDACTFKFAFNEEMSNLWYEYEECDYSYIFTLGPADIANGLT